MNESNENILIKVIKKAFTRLSDACNQSDRFLAFMIVGVIGCGGAGIWIPALASKDVWAGLVDTGNHFTYSIAILFTLCIERILIYDKEDSDEKFIGLLVILGFFAILLVSIGYKKDIWYCAVIGTSISILILSITYANDPRFYKKSITNSHGYTSPIGFSNLDPNELNNQEGGYK